VFFARVHLMILLLSFHLLPDFGWPVLHEYLVLLIHDRSFRLERDYLARHIYLFNKGLVDQVVPELLTHKMEEEILLKGG